MLQRSWQRTRWSGSNFNLPEDTCAPRLITLQLNVNAYVIETDIVAKSTGESFACSWGSVRSLAGALRLARARSEPRTSDGVSREQFRKVGVGAVQLESGFEGLQRGGAIG